MTNHTPELKGWNGQSSFFQRLVVTLVMVAAVLLLWGTLHIFLLIFLGIILAVFLRKSGEMAGAILRVPDRLGISLVIVLLVLVVLLAIRFMAPQILYQVGELTRLIPSSWEQAKEGISGNPLGGWLIQNMPSFQGLTGVLGGLMHQTTAWLYTVFGLALSGVIIVVLGILVATPLTGSLIVLIKKLYIQNILGEREGESGRQKREFRRQEPGDRREGQAKE